MYLLVTILLIDWSFQMDGRLSGDCQKPGGCALHQLCAEILWPCDVTPLWYLELCRLGMSPGALDMFGAEEGLTVSEWIEIADWRG
jgi:hypothetical protein